MNLVTALGVSGRFGEAEELVQEIKVMHDGSGADYEVRRELSKAVYNLVTEYAVVGRIEESLRIFDELECLVTRDRNETRSRKTAADALFNLAMASRKADSDEMDAVIMEKIDELVFQPAAPTNPPLEAEVMDRLMKAADLVRPRK